MIRRAKPASTASSSRRAERVKTTLYSATPPLAPEDAPLHGRQRLAGFGSPLLSNSAVVEVLPQPRLALQIDLDSGLAASVIHEKPDSSNHVVFLSPSTPNAGDQRPGCEHREHLGRWIALLDWGPVSRPPSRMGNSHNLNAVIRLSEHNEEGKSAQQVPARVAEVRRSLARRLLDSFKRQVEFGHEPSAASAFRAWYHSRAVRASAIASG